MFMLFAAIIGGPDKQHMANRIWHSIQSDKAQRELLLNAAEASVSLRSPGLFADIKWAIDRANDIGGQRNAVAHTSVWTVIQPDGKRTVTPDPQSSRWSAIARLTATPTAKIWRKVRGDLYALADFVSLIDAHVRHGPLAPLRSRPRLQSVQAKSASRSRPRKQPKRAPPPRS
jgi:hypothetical protein